MGNITKADRLSIMYRCFQQSIRQGDMRNARQWQSQINDFVVNEDLLVALVGVLDAVLFSPEQIESAAKPFKKSL